MVALVAHGCPYLLYSRINLIICVKYALAIILCLFKKVNHLHHSL